MHRVFTTVIAALLLSGTSSAGTIFYLNEAAFLGAAGGGLSFEGFESLTVTNMFTSSAIAATDFTIADSQSKLGVADAGIALAGMLPTEGTNFAAWAAQPITAFGVTIKDPLDGAASGQLFISAGIDSSLVATGELSSGVVVFAGLITDTPLTQVSFNVTQTPSGGDGLSLDKVRYGTAAVPEPTTLLLLGTGLAIAGYRRRRKRQTKSRC